MHTNKSEFTKRLAENDGEEALARARETLVRALEELDHYINKFEAANDSRLKAEILNWTLNFLSSSIANNLRLDLLANAQAKLTSLADH
jgi:hypothetical protein